MAVEGREIIKRHLAALRDGFYCHRDDGGEYLVVGTPYLYPNNDGICLYIEELPGGQARVSDGGETAHLNLWKECFDIFRSPWAMAAAKKIAHANRVEFDGGKLAKSGPAEEVGEIMLDVAMAAHGVAHLSYLRRRYWPSFAPGKATRDSELGRRLEAVLAEGGVEFAAGVALTGGSGQVYTAHYRVNGGAYLQALDPGRAGRAKAAVDRTFGMWADCNGDLTVERKLTLLNDETVEWKAAHIERLSQVSTVVRWSEGERLAALLAGLSG